MSVSCSFWSQEPSGSVQALNIRIPQKVCMTRSTNSWAHTFGSFQIPNSNGPWAGPCHYELLIWVHLQALNGGGVACQALQGKPSVSVSSCWHSPAGTIGTMVLFIIKGYLFSHELGPPGCAIILFPQQPPGWQSTLKPITAPSVIPTAVFPHYLWNHFLGHAD